MIFKLVLTGTNVLSFNVQVGFEKYYTITENRTFLKESGPSVYSISQCNSYHFEPSDPQGPWIGNYEQGKIDVLDYCSYDYQLYSDGHKFTFAKSIFDNPDDFIMINNKLGDDDTIIAELLLEHANEEITFRQSNIPGLLQVVSFSTVIGTISEFIGNAIMVQNNLELNDWFTTNRILTEWNRLITLFQGELGNRIDYNELDYLKPFEIHFIREYTYWKSVSSNFYGTETKHFHRTELDEAKVVNI